MTLRIELCDISDEKADKIIENIRLSKICGNLITLDSSLIARVTTIEDWDIK